MGNAKKPVKQKQVTLFFEDKERCQRACEALCLSLRKVADIDRTHAGSYSKTTGHYGFKFSCGNTVRVPLRSKLMIDADVFYALTDVERMSLGALEVTSSGWIAP